jgi:hypothetical protein
VVVAGSSDPLGKRALFWAPAERDEDGPPRRGRSMPRGRHALYSSAEPVEASVESRPRGIFGALVGPILLDCSSCGSRTDVEAFEFLLLHMPLWFWRPGKGYTSLMLCPSCRKRTWISVSLPAWSR